MVSIAAHGGLAYYVYETKFAPHYRVWGEDPVTVVTLNRAEPQKPPEPPKPAVKQEQPPPPLAPHMTPSIPDSIAPPPTLPIAPVPPPPLPPVQALPPEPAKPASAPVIANPNWSSRPSGEDMARFYPERAQRLEKTGSVLLQCQVTAKGSVAECQVLAEGPAGFGFGEAALKLSGLFRMKPRMEDGRPVEGAIVKIPIAFRLAD
jgi:protein TonB